MSDPRGNDNIHPFSSNRTDAECQVRDTHDDGAEVVWRLFEDLGDHYSNTDLEAWISGQAFDKTLGPRLTDQAKRVP